MSNTRLGSLFSTSDSMHYFYDSGTGKIINCSDEEKTFIHRILNNELSLQEACHLDREFSSFIESENLFACPEKRKFMIPTKDEFKEMLIGSCEQLILEVTEACNLRCDYCIYHEHHPNFRGFGNRHMTYEIAQKSVDIVLKDYKKERFALSFYGGEPLIQYPLMKRIIKYIQVNYPNIILDVAFTTNLTLLTEEMVSFFSSLDHISILCSVDGPKNIHDQYRKDLFGNGCYEETLRGLRLLLDHYYENGNPNKTLGLNCVVNPPYSDKTLNEIRRFFREELSLPLDISCNYSYVDRGDMKMDLDQYEVNLGNENGALEVSPIEEWAVKQVMDNQSTELFSVISQDMLRVAKRMKAEDGVIGATYLHGNCIPGQRRMYVNVDGSFKICERVGTTPTVGNYESGYLIDEIYKVYFEDYAQYFEEVCKDCWAQSLCSVCYERTMGENGIKEHIEDKICKGSRKIITDSFINYYKLLENNHDLFESTLMRYEKARVESEGVRKYEVFGESL